jgi:replicative DNA helicase
VSEPTIQLPFDPAKQKAILGHCLRDNAFFLQCRTKLLPEWFNDYRQGKVYKAMLAFYREFGRQPTKVEIKGYKELVIEEGPERGSLQSMVDQAWNGASEIHLDVIRLELTAWYHARLYREGVEKSNNLYNDGRFSDAYAIMSEKMNLIRTSRFDEDIELSFENPDKFLALSEQSYMEGLTTGLSILDAALTPDGSPTPGLYRGDMTVFLAPSNVGKTTALLTVVGHNVLNKEPTLLLTHEGRPQDIREKVLCSILRKTKPELFAMYKTPLGAKVIRRITTLISQYLTYIPYNRAGMLVEDVAALIRRRQEERIAKDPDGRGYSLLVDDYPAKLSTERAKGGHLAQRNLDAVVYDYFVQLALEMNLHALVAVQTNRQGSKDNRDAERLLTMEDVRESWDVMTMATNVISINRDVTAAQNNRVTFYVCKSRSSETGRAIVARSKYAACVTHWNHWGGTWYRGEATLSDQIDQFLKIRDGKEITATDIQTATAAAA